MKQPNEGLFVHGGSENYNHGPIRCACLDLSTGEVVFDEEWEKNHREGMEHGTAKDAAVISIFSAIILCHKKTWKPIIYCKDRNAINWAHRLLVILGRKDELLVEEDVMDMDIHELIKKACKAIDFDTSAVDIRLWDKNVHGENPLARGWDGKK